MSSSIKTQSLKDTSYHGFLHGFSDGLFKVTVIGCQSETVKPRLSIETRNFKKLLKDFPKTFNSSFKSITFKIAECFIPGGLESIAICQQLKEQVEKLKIPYYFLTSEMFLPTCALAASKIICETGDVIFIPIVCSNYICSYAYRREADGYVNLRQHLVTLPVIQNPETFRSVFYGGLDPKKIIVIPNPPNTPMIKTLRTIVDAKKLVIAPGLHPENETRLIVETYKWLSDPAVNNAYHFKPRSTRQFYASPSERNNIENAESVIDYNEELPLTRKYLFPRTISQLYLTYNKGHPDRNVHFFKTCTPEAGDCHRYELRFTIDQNNFPAAEIKNIMIQQIEALPNTLDQFMKSRDPVIVFFDNSSVILLFNEKRGKYEFLESWNGIYGRDIFLNLKPQRPILEYQPPTDETSIITFNEICSFTACQPIPTLNRGLKLIKNATTESTLQFDTSDGSQKHSTPSFLVALILKEHYQAIKKETGIRHEKIGIHYFQCYQESKKIEEARNNDQRYVWQLTQAFQTKHEIQVLLGESCNMLRVQYSDEATKALESVGFTLDNSRVMVMPTIHMNTD